MQSKSPPGARSADFNSFHQITPIINRQSSSHRAGPARQTSTRFVPNADNPTIHNRITAPLRSADFNSFIKIVASQKSTLSVWSGDGGDLGEAYTLIKYY